MQVLQFSVARDDRKRELYNYLNVLMHSYIFVLQNIGVRHHTTEDRFTAMLTEWLQSSPTPTWPVLVVALRSEFIKGFDIAAKIEDKYIVSKDTVGE